MTNRAGGKGKPQLVHDLQGTSPRRDLTNVVDFVKVIDFPKPATHLNEDGQKLWNELGMELVRCGVLQTVDLIALEMLCYAWQRHQAKARQQFDMTAAEQMTLKSLLVEFGCTPAARRRVTVDDGDSQKQNRFKKFKKASNG